MSETKNTIHPTQETTSTIENVSVEEKAKKTVPEGFWVRTIAAAVLIAILIVSMLLGRWTFSLFVTFCFGMALYEELHALTKAGNAPVWWISFAGLVVSIPMILFTRPLMVIPYMSFLAFCALFCIMRRKEPKLLDLLFTMLPLLSIVLPATCIFGLLTAENSSIQFYLLCIMFFISVIGDTFAYLIGNAMGGPKLCPVVSPKKTVTGAIGGMLGSILSAILVTVIFKAVDSQSIVFPSMWVVICFGIFGGFASQIGDLLASLIKRHCGIKDFSNLIPGHGGMMDRIDSILFCGVIIYCYRLLFFP